MHPDSWQPVRRLLLVHTDETAAASLTAALQVLRQALPCEQTCLTLTADTYQFSPSPLLDSSPAAGKRHSDALIQAIHDRHFDAAIIFTAPDRSPYSLAYLCYLAGIPLRLGQSREFGGSVLSHCIPPPIDPVSIADHHLHLLTAAGFSISTRSPVTAATPPS